MGKKGGGGGGQTQQVGVPQGIYQTGAAATGLGQYAASLLNPLSSMTQWASSLATGGNAGTSVPSYGTSATMAGPRTVFGGHGGGWASSFDPTTGLITFTWPGDPSRTFQSDIAGARSRTDIPASTLDQWQQAYSQTQGQQQQAKAGSSWEAVANQYGLSWTDIGRFESMGFSPSELAQWGQIAQSSGYSWTQVEDWKKQGFTPQEVAAGYTTGTAEQAYEKMLGPQLGLAWHDIQQQQAATGKLSDLMKTSEAFTTKAQAEADLLAKQGQAELTTGTNLLSGAGKTIGEGEAMLKEATTGTGLYASQAATIEEAKKTEEQNIEATLGGMGLGTSTQKAQLKGEADLAAAGEAGKLVQGNISAAQEQIKLGQAEQTIGISEQQTAQQQLNLSQAASKLALAGQTLTLTEQGALVTELKDIATQSSDMQKTLWTEAMQGYGAIGTMLDASTKAYGLSLSAYNSAAQILLENAKTSEAAQQAQQSADASSSSSLFGALGKLLGGAGGTSGSGGLLGSLFGSSAAGAVGSAASSSVAGIGGAAAGGTAAAAGGGSGLLAGIGAALTVIFCSVAQEVYGVEGWQWIIFQRWLLFRAPKWLRALYAQHALWFAAWIKDRPRVKSVLRFFMNFVVNGEFA